MIRFSALIVVAVALVACEAGVAAPAHSGIRGRVVIGPMCPVVQEGVPCPDKPLAATIRVRKAGGRVVATAHSGEEGRFRVRLAPGRYVLEPVSPNAGVPPYAAPLTVRVRSHRFTEITVSYDSGIR